MTPSVCSCKALYAIKDEMQFSEMYRAQHFHVIIWLLKGHILALAFQAATVFVRCDRTTAGFMGLQDDVHEDATSILRNVSFSALFCRNCMELL